jgi:cytochrome subunit of sulfide dehydrogenase
VKANDLVGLYYFNRSRSPFELAGESMKNQWIGAVLVLWLVAATTAQAQNLNVPRALAATCATCHGTDGRSTGGVPPSLAGQNRQVLLQALRDFREGKRPATVMQQQMKGLTDAQFEMLADYFSALKP